MLVQAYGAALLIILASVVLGRAICVAAGGEQAWWAAPAVGFASLIVLTGAAIKLPGRGVTALVVVGVVLTVASGFLLLRRSPPVSRGDLVVGALSLLGTSLPFIASGRVGLLGVSLDNDTANHLLYAESLISSRVAALWGTGAGYPLGPHSVVAAVGTATGMPLDMAFTGLLVAIVPITALVAAGLVAAEALWRRVVIGLMCSLTYLVAAFYAEGAFKELILAGLLLASVVHLEQARARWSEADTGMRWRSVLIVGIFVAAAFYTYSYPGLAWFAVSATIWIGVEAAIRVADRPRLLTQPRLLFGWQWRGRLSKSTSWVIGTALVAVVVLLPVAGQAISFFRSVGLSPAQSGAIPTNALGNLIAPLSPYEMLGVWTSPDFRHYPTNGFHAGELSAFALIVLLYGLVWSVRRRKLLLPAAAAGSVVIWWLSDRSQSPYITAKALVIGAPVIMALALRGLLTRRAGPLSTRVLVLTVAALFCGFAAYSSYQALRNEPVAAPEPGRELASFQHSIGGAPVLFLGDDDYAPWQLRDAAVSALAANTRSLGAAAARTNKPYVFEQALDFDSVDPADLDHFHYVVTTNTSYASQPPANFRLAAQTRLYDLWKRTGPTASRQVLEPSGAPGAALDCRSALGKKLRAVRGQASIMSKPVTVPGPSLTAGSSTAVPIALPGGEWEISIQYFSSFVIDLSTQGRRWTMPAYLGRLGPFFTVGTVTGRGVASPVTLTVRAERPSFLTGSGGNLFTAIPVIAATRIPDSRRIVPLRRACGQYVDWYRLS
jgi:hypothetical protein